MAARINPRFSDAQVSEIVSRYMAGESRNRLAEAFKSTQGYMTKLLVRQGVSLRDEWEHRLTEAQEAEMMQRYQTGEATENLVRDYGVSLTIVRRIARRHGVPIRSVGQQPRRWTDDDLQHIRQWCAERVTLEEIALRLHMHTSNLRRIMDRYDIPRPFELRGERSGSWMGGRALTGEGYVLVYIAPDDPFASMRRQNGYVSEHRIVMARALGRVLRSDEVVHHKNGDRTDNRLENLQLTHSYHGKGSVWRCADCGSHNIVPESLEKA